MSAQSMLEQLLKTGKSMIDKKGGVGGLGAGLGSLGGLGGLADGLKGLTGGGSDGNKSGKSGQGFGQLGMGAAAGGALGLLLGNKRGRSFGGKALQYGSIAALGAMAYKAFSVWQEKQAAQAAVPASRGGAVNEYPPAFGAGPSTPLRTVNMLSAPEAESHSQAMLVAMIAAAKADGHLDDRERSLVEAELNRLEADPGMRRWFEEQLRRPLDPAEVAKSATTPEIAGEMYLASLLIADETSFMERAYLDELARRLGLPDGLKRELEAQAIAV